MKYIEGNLIELAKSGNFDVITHGCNCFCTMRSGIAPQMAAAFDCNVFPLEKRNTKGDINKLGQIDWEFNEDYNIYVVNSYTQYDYKRVPNIPNINYEALSLCFVKINKMFGGKTLGIPQIGANLAGGDWNIIEKLIDQVTPNMDVTCVIYKP